MGVALVGFGRFGRALGSLLTEAQVPYRAFDPQADVPQAVRATEFAELVSGKTLDLAVWSDSFASEPNEKVGPPIWRRNASQQYRPEPRGIVIRCGEHPPAVRAKNRARNRGGVA